MPVLNWLAYAYLVPAACLLGVRGIWRAVERMRRRHCRSRSRERGLGNPCCTRAGSRSLGRRGRRRHLRRVRLDQPHHLRRVLDRVGAHALGRATARARSDAVAGRVVMRSRCWPGNGARLERAALVEPGFLVLSIGKVFLYDLGELRDLYRVASLVGLAMSLILVSLATNGSYSGAARVTKPLTNEPKRGAALGAAPAAGSAVVVARSVAARRLALRRRARSRATSPRCSRRRRRSRLRSRESWCASSFRPRCSAPAAPICRNCGSSTRPAGKWRSWSRAAPAATAPTAARLEAVTVAPAQILDATRETEERSARRRSGARAT